MNRRAVVRTEVEDHQEIGMIERAGRARFLLETLQMIAILEIATGRTLMAT